jgi:hypothetical protein
MLGLTDSDGNVRTVGAYAVGNHLSIALKVGEATASGVARLEGFHPFTGRTLDGSMWGPSRFGSVSADYPAWPWKLSLGWLAGSLESVLAKQMLAPSQCEPFQKERYWSLVRSLVGQSGLQHRPIAANDALLSVTNLLSAMTQQGTSHASIGSIRPIVSSRDELEELIGLLKAQKLSDELGMIHRPYPVPDATPIGGYIENLYSNKTLRLLVERVYENALTIYGCLIDTFFPLFKPMLAMGCMLPMNMQCELYPLDEGSFGSTLAYSGQPIPVNESSRVAVRLVESGIRSGRSYEESLAAFERTRSLVQLYHPNSEGWARPPEGSTGIAVFKDKPATCLAYYWLWEDLKILHAVEKMPPHGEEW